MRVILKNKLDVYLFSRFLAYSLHKSGHTTTVSCWVIFFKSTFGLALITNTPCLSCFGKNNNVTFSHVSLPPFINNILTIRHVTWLDCSQSPDNRSCEILCISWQPLDLEHVARDSLVHVEGVSVAQCRSHLHCQSPKYSGRPEESIPVVLQARTRKGALNLCPYIRGN